MRVVVTGGAGFIGSNLVRRHVERGDSVAVVDNFATGYRENLEGLDVEVHDGSVEDGALLDRAFDGADAIVHLAALGSIPRSIADPAATHAANVTGTLQVLEAARRAGSPHVVFSSSSSVYGRNPVLPRAEHLVPMPISPYAASKLAGEALVLAWAETYGLTALAFRFFNVFGPHQAAGHAYAAVMPAFISAVVEGRSLPLHGDGTQSRDFTYVDDVCSVLIDAATRRVASPTPVNLAFGTRISLLEVIALLEEILGRPIEIDRLPPRVGDVPTSESDATRLLELFPDATGVDFRTALEETVAWFRRRR
jgi:UDP-glucose 4-epimerase